MVRTAPIVAQAFSQLPEDVQELVISNGAFPVNEIFWDLMQEDWAMIWLLYGGYGSGKSVFAADYLIDQCLKPQYFKLLFIRKILDTLRETVFATICDRIEERGLEEKFTYSRKPNSSMTIRCLENDNIMLPFGCDNPKKLKSLKDPTHILCEEFDQFEDGDFKMLYPRLRKQGVKLLFIGLFNTEPITPGHWIKKFFFNPEKPFEGKLLTRFCNYTDNAFVDHQAYKETLWISAGFDPDKFEQIAAGEWGSEVADNQFAYSFRRDKHIVSLVTPGNMATAEEVNAWQERRSYMAIDDRLPVHLVFDFNVDPITCLVCQRNGMNWGKIIREYRLRNSDIFELCERIKTDLDPHKYFLVATGDASGRNRSANSKAKASYVDNIKQELRLSPNQIQFPAANPSVSNTRIVLNKVLAKHPEFKISSECLFLIDDMETVRTDGKGGIDKSMDPLKTHLLDNARYFTWNYFRNYLQLK